MSARRCLTLLVSPAMLVCAALGLPASASAATPCQDADVVPSPANLDELRAATLCLINEQRSSRGLVQLTSSSPLRAAAQRYSRSMVDQRFFSHVSPGGSTLTSRVHKQTTYLRRARSWTLGENIAWGSGALGTPAHTVAAWMNSPDHRANILKRGFRHIGMGVASGAPRPTNGLSAATYTTDFGSRR